MNDGRALTEHEFIKIQRDFYSGFYDDKAIGRLFETILVQRRVLSELLGLFRKESPLRSVSIADPVPNSQLTYYRELVSLENQNRREELP